MILKIQHEDTWIVYDNLTRVRFGYSQDGQCFQDTDGLLKMLRDGEKFNIDPDAVWFVPSVGEKRKAPKDLAWVSARTRDNEESLFVFEMAYILNDQGKTLERLM